MISNILIKAAYRRQNCLLTALPACYNLYPTSPPSRMVLAQMVRCFSTTTTAMSSSSSSDRLAVIQCQVQKINDSDVVQTSSLSPGLAPPLKSLRGAKQINNLRSQTKYAFSTMGPIGVASLGDQKFPAISFDNDVDWQRFNTRIAESFDDVLEAVSLNEPKMCTQAIIEVLSKDIQSDHYFDAKVLDFEANNAQIGQLLTEQGLTELYAQCGNQAKNQSLQRKNIYKEIETFIVGKQGLPKSYRRTFDIVTCAGGLGTNLLPAKSFDDMLAALRPGGFAVFTVSQKHLKPNGTFGMGYYEAIDRLITRGAWKPLINQEFVKYHGIGNDNLAKGAEHYSLLVFQKKE